ncbi:MAG: NACHT domain-containing protein [Thermosynechococcaceae cyanobacterium]
MKGSLMSGPLGEIAGKGAGSAIAKVGASILEKAVDKGIKIVKDQPTWARLFRKYEDKYLERYGMVKLLGMRQGLALDKIYTGVRILDDVSIRQFESLEALEKSYRDRGLRRFQQRECRLSDDGKPENGIEVANQQPCLMVLGGPGAGKSTYLRRIGLAAARGEANIFEHNCIPIMLELKQFKNPLVDLEAAIAKEFANVGFDFSEAFVEEALRQGKLLVLFDGLDEIPKANQDKVIDAIQNFVNRYDNNRFMVSCRVAAYRSGFRNFTEIELADFDDEQIQQFINNWFTATLDQQNDTANQCWMLLNEDSQKSAKELVQTPLLLTFLCIYYDKKQSFAAHRATLYRKALDILLDEWAAEKRVRHVPVYEGLNTALEKVMLAEIAYQSFVNDQLFFTEQELIDQIRNFLEDSVDKPKYLNSKAVLDAIAEQQGILVKRAEDVYSFSHLTLQEYLVAQHISQDFEEIVKQYLTEQRWREVLLLVPGLLSKADKMLRLMNQTAEQQIDSSTLRTLFVWAEQVTSYSDSDAPPLVRRYIAISLILSLASALALASVSDLAFAIVSASDLALSSASDLDFSLARALLLASASALASTQVFNSSVDFAPVIEEIGSLPSLIANNQVSAKQLQTISDRLPQLCHNALNLDLTFLDISSVDAGKLLSYLYIHNLMVQCKEAAVRVSRNAWEEIESTMLLPSKTE